MKQKIKEALQLTYKSLGLNEEVFEWVATSAETFTTEENLRNFVDGAEGLLKHYQSIVDKGRRETSDEKKRADDLATKLAEAEAKLNKKTDGEGGKGEQPKQPDFAKLIAEAVTAAVQPLQTELANIKQNRSAEDAFNVAKENFFANDYAKKYTSERDDAWERAVEVNDLTGKKMTAKELEAKAMGYFNTLVSRKGEDITKPFKSEGSGNDDLDFSEDKAILQKEGLLKS